jgi:hypothetical protein
MKRQKIASVTMRVRVGDAELEVSGPSDFVEAKISEFLQKRGASQSPAAEPSETSGRRAETMTRPKSPAQFFKQCSPRTDNDRTLVATYFLEKFRNVENSTAAEIRDVIREARVQPPRNPNDSVNQNIRKGLLMTAGNKDSKMAFVLTSDGEAAVEDMQQKPRE